MATKRPPLFEHTTCSRCAGSGHHSYCQRYGTICFGCGGSGLRLTKRGAAAQAWLNERRSRTMAEIKVGDRFVYDSMFGRAVCTVTAIGPDEIQQNDREPRIKMDSVDSNGKLHCYIGFATSKVQMHFAGEEKLALQREGLAYQATLTKTGKVAKRATKKGN